MPFWAAHTTVSSTTSAGSKRIGQDATPSWPVLAFDQSLRDGPLDTPGGLSCICGAFAGMTLAPSHRPEAYDPRPSLPSLT
jgi:hypothetical protein